MAILLYNVVLLKILTLFLCNYCNCYKISGDTSSSLECRKFNVVKYRATFQADWSEKNFPKQYPTVRPPAQWTKMIGRTHNADYDLWSVGSLAKVAFKKFAQDGTTDLLDKSETQGFDGVFDTFYTPPLKNGVGEIDSDFLASDSHPLISLAARLIPSPDWFVGLDSVPLCVNGSWVREIRIPVDLLDAGIDQGFTFTSPKWASRPQEPVAYITSKIPNHRSSSFYYPHLKRLPHIGHVRFELLADYAERKVHRRVKNYRDDDEMIDLDFEQREKRREELEEQQILHGEPIGSRYSATLSSDQKQKTPTKLERQNVFAPKKGDKLGSKKVGKKYDDSSRISDSSAEDRKFRPSNKIETPISKKPEKQDCMTTEWSTWTQCSKSCGFGVQKRYRKVTQVPVQGKSCPNLVQEKWCGGMRNCRDDMKLFSWLNRNSVE